MNKSEMLQCGRVCFGGALSILWLQTFQYVSFGQESNEYTINATEILRIGDESTGSAELFADIESVAVDSRGNIFVAERVFVAETDGPPVRAFSPDGQLLAVVGARGEGPGEYVRIRGLQVGRADSLYVFDYVRDILLVFAPYSWTSTRQIRIESDDEVWPAGLVGVSAFGPLMEYTSSANPDVELFRQARLVSWSGTPLQELVRLPDMELKFSVSDFSISAHPVPFGRNFFFRYRHGQLYSGWNETIDIQITSPDGESIGRIQMEHEPVSVTRQERNDILNPEVFDEIYTTKPAYQTFVVDDRGQVWIKDQVRDESMEVTWHVLDADGNVVGRARFPRNISVRVIRLEDKKIYATTRADDDSPIVVVYHVEM